MRLTLICTIVVTGVGCSSLSNLPFFNTSSTSTPRGSAVAAPSRPSNGETTAALAVGVLDDAEADKPPTDKDLVAPQAGIERVMPQAPTWCEGANKDDMPHGVIDSSFIPENMGEYIHKDGIKRFGAVPASAAALVAWSACLRPQDKNRQLWIASFRQAMLNTSGMTEAENREYMKLLMMNEDARQKMLDDACAKWEGDPGKTADARTFSTLFIKMLACGAAKEPGRVAEAIGRLSRQPEISSQVALASFVQTCVSARPLEYGDERTLMSPGTIAAYGFCSQDIPRLDRAKFHKELGSLSLSPYERVAAIETFALAKWYTDWQTAAYAAKFGKLPWLKGLVVDAPSQGFGDWMKLYKANHTAVDMANAWEAKYDLNADSKSKLKAAFAGCAPPLRKALSAYIKAKRPQSASHVRQLLADGVGHPLVVANAACEAVAGKPELALGYKHLVFKTALGVEGPRHQAYKHAVKNVADLVEDQAKLPFTVGTFHPSVPVIGQGGWAEKAIETFAGGAGFAAGWMDDDQPAKRGSTPDGVIKSVTPKDAGVLVQFKTENWKEPVYNCTPTNRIDRIDFSGGKAHVIYQQNCKFAGMEPRSFTLRPVWVPAEFAKGLRAGLTARILATSQNDDAPGFVVEAYSDQQRKSFAYTMVTGL